jgi:hypothetical protein
LTTAPHPSPGDCYLAVTPVGVLTLLVGDADDVDRRLCRALLRRPAGQKWVATDLAGLVPGAGRVAAEALYRLMANGAVAMVTTRPRDNLQPQHPVNLDLERLVVDGAEAALLLDDAGLVLAHAGLSAHHAERWAAELAQGGGAPAHVHSAVLGLKLDDGYEAVSCTLVLRDGCAALSPAMLPLVRRLVRARTYA